MNPTLGELIGDRSGFIVPLKHGEIVGRENNSWSQTLSGKHFCIVIVNRKLCIIDMDSTHGTFINGQRIEPNLTYPINHGDEIKAGDINFSVQLYSQGHVSKLSKQWNFYYQEASLARRALSYGFDLTLTGLCFYYFLLYSSHHKIVLKPVMIMLVLSLIHLLIIQLPTFLWARSPGKMFFGTRVFRKDGEVIDFLTVLYREFFCKFIIFFTLPVLGFILFNLGKYFWGSMVLSIYFIALPASYFIFSETFWDNLCDTYLVESKPSEQVYE